MNDQLKRVFSEVLEIRETEVSPDLSMQTARSWDSLAQLRLVSAIESQFGVRFTMDQIGKLQDFQSFSSALAEHPDA